MNGRQFDKIRNETYSGEVHLVNSLLELKTRNGRDCDILFLFQNQTEVSDSGFEIKPKYYILNRLLFLTRVLSLKMYFFRICFFCMLHII